MASTDAVWLSLFSSEASTLEGVGRFVQASSQENWARHMKTIGYLGQIDELFGTPATTRSWNTILSVLRILKAASLGG
jgi:ferritin